MTNHWLEWLSSDDSPFAVSDSARAVIRRWVILASCRS
jgi:hypothetical protein